MNNGNVVDRARRIARSGPVRAAWWVLIVVTTGTGLAVGYFPVWFQIASGPDRSDYLMSAGGYGAAAAVLTVAAVGLTGIGGSRPAAWTAGAGALVLALLAGSSADVAATMRPGTFDASPWEGAAGVLVTPWCWVLLVAGALGIYERISARVRSTGRTFT